MFDQFTTPPEFQIAVTGGSTEENNQLTTAIYHALSYCGFSNVLIDPHNSLTPGVQNSGEVINALRALNPELFESQMMVRGVCDQEQIMAMHMQQQMQSMMQPNYPMFGNWRPQ